MITTVFLFVLTIIGGIKDTDKYQMPDWNTCVAQQTQIVEDSATITTIESPDGTITQIVKPNSNFIVFCAEKSRKCKKGEVCD